MCSYLFNLDSGTVVDSTRKGNKTRVRGALKRTRYCLFHWILTCVLVCLCDFCLHQFINHSSTKPNCFAKIINVNSDYRIGMYALRDIEPNTEVRTCT